MLKNYTVNVILGVFLFNSLRTDQQIDLNVYVYIKCVEVLGRCKSWDGAGSRLKGKGSQSN